MNSVQADKLDPPVMSVTRETVGLFSNSNELHGAVVELDTHFPRHSISVLGGKKDIEDKFGQSAISPSLAEASTDTPLQAPIRSEEKVIGISALIGTSAYLGAVTLALAAGAVSIPATIIAAVIGGTGGAAISGILAKVLGDHYNHEIEDQIEKGGLLLWVHTLNSEQERLASEILNRHHAKHVKVIERNSDIQIQDI